MQFGAAMFFTDYSMAPGELGAALEARGFESLWAPEHSHIPVSRTSPFPNGGDLPKQYYDVMDPFVTLTAAAATTKKLKVGTGVCLVQQRDPIQTAKLVASIDQVSGGRFLFGVGSGWNAEEMADHGTPFKSRHKIARERIEAMKVIWTQSKAEYHGEFVNFDPMMTWPKPVQKPHPPVIVGGAFPYGARRAIRYGDGWVPHASRPEYGDVSDFLPQFHKMVKEAGRDPASLPLTMFRVVEELDKLRHYRDIGIARVVITLPSAGADQVDTAAGSVGEKRIDSRRRRLRGRSPPSAPFASITSTSTTPTLRPCRRTRAVTVSAGVHRGSQIIHPEVDRRQRAPDRHHQRIVADRVDHRGDRTAMPLAAAGDALELRAHRRDHRHALFRRFGFGDG